MNAQQHNQFPRGRWASGAELSTAQNAVAGSIPEQAISCEDREDNGKCRAHSEDRNKRTRASSGAIQSPDKLSVTAGETAFPSDGGTRMVAIGVIVFMASVLILIVSMIWRAATN